MPSLADIPDEIVERGTTADFLDWIADKPIDIRTRTWLLHKWAASRSLHLEKHHYDRAYDDWLSYERRTK